MIKRVLSLNSGIGINSGRFYCSKVNQKRLLPNFREKQEKPKPNVAEKIYSIKPVRELRFPIDPIKDSLMYYEGKASQLKYPDIPFIVNRTSTGKLPVYTERIGRYNNENFTILRKFSGDRNVLKSELSNLLGESIHIKERAESFEIKGDHQKTIAVWLYGLGF